MNLNGWQEADLLALQQFYETGQAWSWAEIDQAASPRGRKAHDWIEASPAPRDHPLILPVLRADQRCEWFALAFSDAQCEELREHLNAFLGPVGSDYCGRRSDLNSGDILKPLVEQWSGGSWLYRFKPLPDCEQQVREALNQMRQVWRLRPKSDRAPLRTTDAMLREFFAALVNADAESSSYWLQQLHLSGRLSAENLHFLQIERQGSLGRWADMLLDARLSMLLAMRRPSRITALLVEAIWRTELAGFVSGNRVTDALAHTRANILQNYGALLQARGSLAHPAVVLAFLAAAVAAIPPRNEQIPILLAALPQDCPERAFAEALAAHVSPSKREANVDPLELAAQAISSRDFDSAWLHLQNTVPNVKSCELRLDCAIELFSPDVAKQTFDAMERMRPEERSQVLKLRSRLRTWREIEELLASQSGKAPSDWETWLGVVDQDPAWQQSLEVAHQGVSEWALKPYGTNPGKVSNLAKQLFSDRPESASYKVRSAIPHIAQFFFDCGVGEPAFLPIYRSLLWLLAADQRFGGQDWGMAQNLGLAILNSGASASEYQEALELLTAIWSQRGDVLHLDWALDILDESIVVPALVPGARDGFFTAVWRLISDNARRVSLDQRQVFKLICKDLGREAEYSALTFPASDATAPEGTNWAEALRGKLVAIYTLTESAGLRAKRTLDSLCSNLDVRLNHDQGGSERLRSLAREADYFVVTTRSAKHAATEFLKDQRPRGKSPFIYPSGKGSSSIVSSIFLAVKTASAS